MIKDNKTREPGRLSRTVAIGAIAGSALGLGALAGAASAQADNCVDSGFGCGWFNEVLSRNNNQIGSNGNGITNQFGAANGNIANGQLNVPVLSPVIAGGNATNAAPTTGGAAVGGAGTSTAADVDVVTAGSALGLNPALGGIGAGG